MEQYPEKAPETGEETDDATESESSFVQRNHNTQQQLYLSEGRYQEERASLILELEQLRQGTHWKYLKVMERLEGELKDRMLWNEIELKNSLAAIERDYLKENADAEQEYADKKAELVANAIAELENEKKVIEQEYVTMGLSEDGVCVMASFRKLRSQKNHSISKGEKQRKMTVNLIEFQLNEEEIESDLETIFGAALPHC
uniref:Uncharacterized protein n=1 Tax=Anopheles epiroticus TaxID=199890 RepID=A0A182PB80_9DIPT